MLCRTWSCVSLFIRQGPMICGSGFQGTQQRQQGLATSAYSNKAPENVNEPDDKPRTLNDSYYESSGRNSEGEGEEAIRRQTKTFFGQSHHPYKQLFPWKSKNEFVETLVQCVVLNSDGLVVINKPFGVGVLKFPEKETPAGAVKDRLYTRGIGSTKYTLQDAVPLLRKALNLPNLVLVKSTQKMTSGLSVFATDSKAAEKFQTKLHLSRSTIQDDPVYRYHVITAYSPHSTKSSFRERVGITQKSSPLLDIRQPVIVREFSKKAMERKEVIPIRVYIQTLGIGLHNTALLEIKTSNVKYHFLQVYCADLIVPILGDHMFACRVKKVMGVPTKIDPSHALPYSSEQELSLPLLRTLNLKTPEDSCKVPLHVHLHSYTVKNYFGKGKHLELEAPYHHYFQWTSEQLQFLKL